MSDTPYREPGHVETDDAKERRLRLEYDCIAISAQTTPEENERALRRMREIEHVLRAMGSTPSATYGVLQTSELGHLFGWAYGKGRRT